MFPVHQNLISGAREDSLCLCVWEGGRRGGGVTADSHMKEWTGYQSYLLFWLTSAPMISIYLQHIWMLTQKNSTHTPLILVDITDQTGSMTF